MSKPLAIVYLDDVAMMHEEWEEALAPWLMAHEITTLHCVGYVADFTAGGALDLLETPSLMNRLRDFDIRLVVADVWMPFPARHTWFGGLHIVRQIALVLEAQMPPVLFASTRPEREAQAKLAKDMRLTLLGDVLIDGDNIRNSAHWERIKTHILRSFDLEETSGVTVAGYDIAESVLLNGMRIYRDVLIDYDGTKIRLQSWSSRAIVFQILARTPKREWRTEDILDLLFQNRKTLAGVHDGWTDLLEVDLRSKIDQRLRNTFDALRRNFPGAFYKVDDGSHVVHSNVRWIEDIAPEA